MQSRHDWRSGEKDVRGCMIHGSQCTARLGGWRLGGQGRGSDAGSPDIKKVRDTAECCGMVREGAGQRVVGSSTVGLEPEM